MTSRIAKTRLTLVAALALVALVEGLSLTLPASAQLSANAKSLTVTTANSVATFSGLDLVGLVNSLTGESYLTRPSAGELAAINTIASTGQLLQSSNWTVGSEPGTGHPLATITSQDAVRRLTMSVKLDPVSQEIVLRLSASTSVPGVRDASWSIAGLNLDTGRLILPSDTGVVIDREHPHLGPWGLSYPYNWHAQMAVYEAANGSFVFYSTDTQMHFKRLRTSTRGSSTIDLGVATDAVAPWASATTVPTIEWRLKAFAGDWRIAAGPYRDWLWTTRPPLSNAAHPWVSNIRAVVVIASDTTLLASLASVVVPSQTLLYICDWRAVPFGVNLPDYTARSGEAAFISAAHALGFKVMLHVDGLGVSTTNPDYGAMQTYQLRHPETLERMGWHWDLPPSAQTRYAFIDPAAAAWRNLLISRVSAGISGLGADAIHIDLSSSMFNDGNGLMGGLNYAQGMAQLHQDFVAAFPGLAFGGEGETEITYRYHSFAQSWWLPGGPTEGHPLASFLFGPQVQFYGHLGQPTAQDSGFKNFLLQLQRRAVLPMLKVTGVSDLNSTNADNARLFGLIQSWQSHAFQLARTADWTGTLVRYEGLAGSTAALTDSGTVTTLTAAGSTLLQIAHDVNEISTPSSVRNWPAFDATKIYGFDPAKRYFLDPIARPPITHLTSLPPGHRLGPGTLAGPGFTHVEVLPPSAASFDFHASILAATLGVSYQGADWPIGNGATVETQTLTAGSVTRSGLFIHPPWQGQVGGETFAEFPVPVPAEAILRFHVGVADNANCSDGVTFRVTVAGMEIWRQHVLRTGWQETTLSLASYAGTTVPVRLISNPGPSGHPNCDWNMWSGVTLLSAPGAASISVPLALSSGSVVSGFEGDGAYSSTGALTGTVTNLAVPGQFTLFTQNGISVSNGTNLATLPFQTWLWSHGELAQPGSFQHSGFVGSATAGGVTKNPAIHAHPPEEGATRLSWLVRLPTATNVRLGWSAGILDNAFSNDGVEFVVRVNGVPYWRWKTLASGWTPGILDLSKWTGQNVLIDLASDAVVNSGFDHAVWADLVLTASTTTCSYSIPSGASVGQSGGTFSFNVTATAACPWATTSGASWLMPLAGSGNSSGVVTYTVAPNIGPPRTATLTVAGQTFSVSQAGLLPTMVLDKTALRFAAVTNGVALLAHTSAQTVRLTQSGAGAVTWTATSNQPWLQVSPASGSGSATLSVSLISTGDLPTPGNGAITLVLAGASNAPGPINVTLTLVANGTSANPFGNVDTPANNLTGVTGAVPFTGWALDDIEVLRVSVCRAAVGAEVAPVDPNCGGDAQIFVGFAVFIDGARPDVVSSYPAHPANTKAGWGFMVLTNMLPNQGNGTYVFHMWAQDRDGHAVLLGSRTMTCANATATKPFGAIDTPTQGGGASGTAFVNFGWALTPLPKMIAADGSTITVLIDGTAVGTVTYNNPRPDIQALFPGLNNTNGAIGFKVLDTTTLPNGLHTISWTVVDNQGAVEGIGSRFFTVSNGASAVTAGAALTVTSARGTAGPRPASSALRGRRGWDLAAPVERFEPDAAGHIVVRSEEVSRVEFHLGEGLHVGHLRTSEGLSPLPVGSRIDPATGVFTWAPGVGFVGVYDLVFTSAGTGSKSPREVRIVLQPKGSHLTGPQVVIDVPRPQQDVGQPFLLGGWAADLNAASGTGMATVHAWAYPLTGGPPVFLGATAYGGSRPDVASVHGHQFESSGFGLHVQGLTPGTYDLAVFGWSIERADFAPASVVRVTVRR